MVTPPLDGAALGGALVSEVGACTMANLTTVQLVGVNNSCFMLLWVTSLK